MAFWAVGLGAQCPSVFSQPRTSDGGVLFTYPDKARRSVVVVGDFNGWATDQDSLKQGADGQWRLLRQMSAGLYQYKFLVDGDRYALDPGNPVRVENFDHSSENSAFLLALSGQVVLTATRPRAPQNLRDEYPEVPGRKAVHLNIIWHQHQPLYVNPATDQLTGPWVRTHATKDYYDMAAILQDYPEVHCTVNLTSSLIVQLQDYYVARLLPFVDLARGTIDAEGFLRRWGGKTDPWIDLALRDPSTYTSEDRDLVYRNPWNALSISEVMIRRFPQYQALRRELPEGTPAPDTLYSDQELREIIFWFYASQFDPDFFRGPVHLPDGSICDLSDLIMERRDSTFVTRHEVSDRDCRRMVVEAVKVMANVLPIHRRLRLDAASGTGQIEIITTPYYHPILPLLYDSDIARVCQPEAELPQRYSFQEDADAQVAKAVRFYRDLFGNAPAGMWPAEGAVSQAVLPIFRRHGVTWTASDAKVLRRSSPPDRPNRAPYRFHAGADSAMVLVFRDTELSDRIGFRYQTYEGEEAAEDFVRSILAFAPGIDDPDVLITVILDGENAWEWYQRDMDGKTFQHALYRKLAGLYRQRRVLTVTTSEYIAGNPRRGIASHPLDSLPVMEQLWPGSWINANFDTWIGEPEENTAWEYLLMAREDLNASGLTAPSVQADPPELGSGPWFVYRAWQAMYAAEGSDWFWWYGADQHAPGGDEPFDVAFRTHLKNVYEFARAAGATMPVREFPPILSSGRTRDGAGSAGGTMAENQAQRTVLFTCDASNLRVPERIYIAGNVPSLGSWVPNLVAMRDDGTGGDRKPGDGVWSLAVELPIDSTILYKYTNSGTRGAWEPGDESPGTNRSVRVHRDGPAVIEDIFGR